MSYALRRDIIPIKLYKTDTFENVLKGIFNHITKALDFSRRDDIIRLISKTDNSISPEKSNHFANKIMEFLK